MVTAIHKNGHMKYKPRPVVNIHTYYHLQPTSTSFDPIEHLPYTIARRIFFSCLDKPPSNGQPAITSKVPSHTIILLFYMLWCACGILYGRQRLPIVRIESGALITYKHRPFHLLQHTQATKLSATASKHSQEHSIWM